MTKNRTTAIIKGAGDLATGVAYRLNKCGLNTIMTEINQPLVVRRAVSFAEAVYEGKIKVEDTEARLAESVEHALELLNDGIIPVLIDPEAKVVQQLHPEIVVDGKMTKRHTDTTINEAPLVIGLGPGFTAGRDVHAVIETCRGHHLGRVIYNGSAIPDTRTPGAVDGYALERLLRAPASGKMLPHRSIGDQVQKGDVVASIADTPVRAEITGVIRGMLKEGIQVSRGTKIGDIDPRPDAEYDTISEKALAVGGGVLEAVFHHLAQA
jgi:xanthine dehydrogenase accessory factor